MRGMSNNTPQLNRSLSQGTQLPSHVTPTTGVPTMSLHTPPSPSRYLLMDQIISQNVSLQSKQAFQFFNTISNYLIFLVQCLSLRKRKLIPCAHFISLQIDKYSKMFLSCIQHTGCQLGWYQGLITTRGNFSEVNSLPQKRMCSLKSFLG